jgi:hypothetical protein
MSVTKTTYAANHSISTRYLRVEKDAATEIIIIDDVVHLGMVEVHTEIDKQVAWLRFTPGFGMTVLDEAPSGITAFSPTHGAWVRTRLFAQSSEVFVVMYTSMAKTEQAEVTGYSMGSSDMVYVKIDQTSGEVTIYHQ